MLKNDVTLRPLRAVTHKFRDWMRADKSVHGMRSTWE